MRLALEEFAKACAALDAGLSRSRVLARLSLDESAWTETERQCIAELKRACAAGEPEAALEYLEGYELGLVEVRAAEAGWLPAADGSRPMLDGPHTRAESDGPTTDSIREIDSVPVGSGSSNDLSSPHGAPAVPPEPPAPTASLDETAIGSPVVQSDPLPFRRAEVEPPPITDVAPHADAGATITAGVGVVRADPLPFGAPREQREPEPAQSTSCADRPPPSRPATSPAGSVDETAIVGVPIAPRDALPFLPSDAAAPPSRPTRSVEAHPAKGETAFAVPIVAPATPFGQSEQGPSEGPEAAADPHRLQTAPLTLQQCAAVYVELHLDPAAQPAVLARYGLSANLKQALDDELRHLCAAHPAVARQWRQHCATYLAWRARHVDQARPRHRVEAVAEEPTLNRTSDELDGTAEVDLAHLAESALPFAGEAQPPPPAAEDLPPRMNGNLDETVHAESVDLGEPLPFGRSSEGHTSPIPLDEYARFRAHCVAHPGKRAQLRRRHGLDEASEQALERQHDELLATDPHARERFAVLLNETREGSTE